MRACGGDPKKLFEDDELNRMVRFMLQMKRWTIIMCVEHKSLYLVWLYVRNVVLDSFPRIFIITVLQYCLLRRWLVRTTNCALPTACNYLPPSRTYRYRRRNWVSEDRDSKSWRFLPVCVRVPGVINRKNFPGSRTSSLADDYLPKQVVSPPTLIIGHLEGL